MHFSKLPRRTRTKQEITQPIFFTDIWEPYSAVRVLKKVSYLVTQTRALLNINKHL